MKNNENKMRNEKITQLAVNCIHTQTYIYICMHINMKYFLTLVLFQFLHFIQQAKQIAIWTQGSFL